MDNNDKRKDNYEDSYDDGFGYSREDLDQMYQDAFEGDPEAQWNID